MSLLSFTAIVQVLLPASRLAAQAGTTSLRGAVTDATQAVIPGAQVTLADPAIGLSRTASTARDGAYQFLQLPPGTYTVTATAQGFAPATREGIVLFVDTPATLNLSLSVNRVQSQVEVTGETELNSTDATLGNPFDSK